MNIISRHILVVNEIRVLVLVYLIYFLIHSVAQWFPMCGTRTTGGMRRTGWGYTNIIFVMAENTKKGVKIKTQ
jgi:hypothetical protein